MFNFSKREPEPVSVRAEAALQVEAVDQAEQVQPEEEDGGGRWKNNTGGSVQWKHSSLAHRESPVPLGRAGKLCEPGESQQWRPGGGGCGHDAASAETTQPHLQTSHQQQQQRHQQVSGQRHCGSLQLQPQPGEEEHQLCQFPRQEEGGGGQQRRVRRGRSEDDRQSDELCHGDSGVELYIAL